MIRNGLSSVRFDVTLHYRSGRIYPKGSLVKINNLLYECLEDSSEDPRKSAQWVLIYKVQ